MTRTIPGLKAHFYALVFALTRTCDQGLEDLAYILSVNLAHTTMFVQMLTEMKLMRVDLKSMKAKVAWLPGGE